MATLDSSSGRSSNLTARQVELNRRVLNLVGSFRLLLVAGLILILVFQSDPPILGGRYPLVFLLTTLVYTLSALVIALLLRGERRNGDHFIWLHFVVDISCLTLATHASGGIGSGLEGILVLFVVANGITMSIRSGYLAAATGVLITLFEQTVSFLEGASTVADFFPAGVIGAIMLGIVVAIQPVMRRVSESEKLAHQRRIDLENLGQLNEYIIQNLREAILVADETDRIRLLNQAAAEQIGIAKSASGQRLEDVAPPVYALLKKWRAGQGDLSTEMPSFLSADGSTVIHAHFASLGEGNGASAVLIFLEDADLLAEKVRQTKLAALGRLSASIAHEIRNPVGAMSHAAQLLGESGGIEDEDKRFIDIIQMNSSRVSEIIDNILQLSRREDAKPVRMALLDWTNNFVSEFVNALELHEGQVSITSNNEVYVRMDSSHLHQIAWNLCENAIKHASATAGVIAVELSYGRLPNNGRPYLEISDQGPGIPDDMVDSVFEPFTTGAIGGTGLGLYICRELCERNSASLSYRSRSGGGSIFRIVFADPGRWD